MDNLKVKASIKKYMTKCNLNLKAFSKKSNINYFILIWLLYFPFSKIKLTQAIKICKSLDISVCQLL